MLKFSQYLFTALHPSTCAFFKAIMIQELALPLSSGETYIVGFAKSS
jgi:hypothetical protein